MHQPAIPSDITEKPKGVFAIGGDVGSMLAVINLAETRLNPYLVDIINLREHCAWVHPNDPAGVTRKKCELIRTGVERVRHVVPIYKQELHPERAAQVIDDELSGMATTILAYPGR